MVKLAWPIQGQSYAIVIATVVFGGTALTGYILPAAVLTDACAPMPDQWDPNGSRGLVWTLNL